MENTDLGRLNLKVLPRKPPVGWWLHFVGQTLGGWWGTAPGDRGCSTTHRSKQKVPLLINTCTYLELKSPRTMAKDKRSKAPPPAAPATAATGTAAAASPPSWPPFKPSLPVVDLTPDSLVQDKVVVLRSFFPRSLCRDYVSFLRELPLITTPGKPKRGEALRVNDRFQISDARFANRLWTETGLKDALASKDVAKLWCVGRFLSSARPARVCAQSC